MMLWLLWACASGMPCESDGEPTACDGAQILFLQVTWGEMRPSYGVVERVNRAYAQRYGYAYVHERVAHNEFAARGECQFWQKVASIAEYIDSYDYVLFVDMDAMVVNFERRLEDFVHSEHADIIMGGHAFGFDTKTHLAVPLVCNDMPLTVTQQCGVNTGVMMFRRSAWSSKFLQHWLEQRHDARFREFFCEQQSLQQMLLDNTLDIRAHITLVPAEEINTCDDKKRRGTQTKAEVRFIAHLWANTEEARMAQLSALARRHQPPPWIDITCPITIPPL